MEWGHYCPSRGQGPLRPGLLSRSLVSKLLLGQEILRLKRGNRSLLGDLSGHSFNLDVQPSFPLVFIVLGLGRSRTSLKGCLVAAKSVERPSMATMLPEKEEKETVG